MKVYLDIIFLCNIIFDFIILISTSLILKRNTKLYRIILGSLFGSFTLIILFIRMNQIELFLYKLIVSIFMIIISFGYKNIKYTFKNIYYMYLISMILGGFLTFINNSLSNINEGLLFINSNIKINIIISIILSIFLLISYIKNIKELKTNYNKYYKIDIYFNKNKISLNGFLDTGNKLIDPYKGWPIILVDKDKININKNYIFVPYNTISSHDLLKCIKVDKIYIEKIGIRKKLLLGLTDNINIDGVDCILNEKLLEG
ncbi:MAG: sigma-E processing peptidase SpoIIGA [Bacilli bacterium]|nr:sigma-E processing peptidase SpoIIGA [Bacilli bacterium]